MARLLVNYAHPGHRLSQVNKPLANAAASVEGVTFVDLYREYPRFEINIDLEQERLIAHDVILFQFPFFWYSTPALVKEWEDLVLEHGFAYGSGGDKLAGKTLMLAITAAGPDDAYAPDGYQHFSLREFLRPLEQTAALCHMEFSPPYVLFGSLKAPKAGQVQPHVAGYRQLLEAVRDDRYDFDTAAQQDFVTYQTLPIREDN